MKDDQKSVDVEYGGAGCTVIIVVIVIAVASVKIVRILAENGVFQ